MTNPYRPGNTRTDPLAIVSLVSAFFLSLAAVITGHIALHRIKRTGDKGRGLAIAGVVIGYAGLVAGAITIVLVITSLSGIGDQIQDNERDPSSSSTEAPSTSAVDGAPSPSLAENRDWTGTITINGQDVGVTLDGAAAPQAVSSFLSLSDDGFFDGTSCHRLVTEGIYVLQCGDPTGTGTGGPGYSYGPIENAPKDDVYPAGTLAMARIGGDGESMGSQFFIVYADSTIPSDAAGGYTVLGTITSGLDVVTKIADDGTKSGASDGKPADPAVIDGVSLK
ncbi:peptidylprolyl isomerase [Agreia pratensis]|uniref:peptidylprolyl isomerase n=1 Tax=Agreia pratensis TaxID=150121 RepID=A0A1X7JMK3_9MICO|nr:peptidylprolyl isomerase [Agreia pratensis]SMG28876.1 peptidyl-prolyl cis-trans isomerase B (cyclophilin B) [Agreia pratensis]